MNQVGQLLAMASATRLKSREQAVSCTVMMLVQLLKNTLQLLGIVLYMCVLQYLYQMLFTYWHLAHQRNGKFFFGIYNLKAILCKGH